MSPEDWRKHRNYSIDPCQDIEPALLNSVHIKRYGRKECLVTDFDPERVNPASYTMCLLGTLYWWGNANENAWCNSSYPSRTKRP